MKKKHFYYLATLLFLISMASGFAYSESSETEGLPQASNDESQSATTEAFDKMMAVLTHKRCVNCHPSGDRPRQGEDSHYHNFGVQRGEDNHGLPALQCATCHQEENNDFSGVPGAPEWSLAPLRMQWEGLSRVEIARSILDPARNGGRSLAETVKHLTEHELVLWAWEPGVDANGTPREKPPVPKEEYIKAVKEWAAAGAQIPEQ
ncbi:MAG: hypothetical protein H6557_26640 [Lewinellaceae bacterium]|nr:hypothetical protein [Phaeodactylibacter sp.]MCB9040218.1 hypothetical protein [Lewinellaceae bacterium]